MRKLNQLPLDERLPPLEELIADRPKSWQGLRVEWATSDSPEPVFIERFVVKHSGEPTPAYLFGIRHDLTEALVNGESLGGGYFIEYVVMIRSEGDWCVHRLLQRESITYSAEPEANDHLPAFDVEPSRMSLHKPPRWKPSEAHWPTQDGKPMPFLGQVDLPESDFTRAFLTWGISVYVFWSQIGAVDHFKVVEQETHIQTVEDHYLSEE